MRASPLPRSTLPGRYWIASRLPVRGSGLGGAIVALAILFAPPVRAAEADQLIGLFMQGCLPFAGDAQALRKWAAGIGLPALPPEGQRAFLGNQPGVVFDASDPQGKFVVLSGDNGACAATAEQSAPASMATELESALTAAGVGFVVKTDADNPQDRTLHYRAYQARKGDRSWRIVLSTGAHAMLSASP